MEWSKVLHNEMLSCCSDSFSGDVCICILRERRFILIGERWYLQLVMKIRSYSFNCVKNYFFLKRESHCIVKKSGDKLRLNQTKLTQITVIMKNCKLL